MSIRIDDIAPDFTVDSTAIFTIGSAAAMPFFFHIQRISRQFARPNLVQ